MLVFSTELGHAVNRATPPGLALVLPVLLGVLGVIALGSKLLSSQTRRSVLQHLLDHDELEDRDVQDERTGEHASLLSGYRDGARGAKLHAAGNGNDDDRVSRNGDARNETTGPGYKAALQRVVLEILKILGGASLLAVTIVKLMDEATQARDVWTDVLDAGVVAVVACIVVTSSIAIIEPHSSSIIRKLQNFVFGTLLAVLSAQNLIPFFYRARPAIDLEHDLGFAQTAIAGFLVLVLLFTPPRWVPLTPHSPPNPAQLASPISVLLFIFLEGRMWSWYRQTTLKEHSREFLSFVPHLPDYLSSPWILSNFRWKGDELSKDEQAEDDTHEPKVGTVRCFVWTYRLDFAKIIMFSSVWIVFIFISPLSMNLLLRYVQDNEQTALSPYVYVFGIFLAPIMSSVAYQGAVYRLSQIGLRLRALLGHAVYAKVLRVKAGGGGTKGDDSEPGGESQGSGGSDALGRVNNLVGTDIDVITTSLTTFLPLFGVLPKLVVSLVFLYVLLGWAAFVALGAIIAFAPVSRAVSKKYGSVQEEIMKATDKRITLVGELVSAIRTIKMFSWERSSMSRIYDARQTELERITKRAKVYAGLMFLSTGVPMVVTLATFAAYVFGMKRSLTASTAFTSMSLFGLLREAVVSSTFLLSAFMRARVSLGRISRFLADTEELDRSPRTFEGDQIEINEGRFRFSRYGSKGFELYIDKLVIPKGKTTIIAGDVGSGKSALLQAVLGEMHKRSGDLKFPASVATSYAAQSPWLQDDSVQANILFGEKYDEERYLQVLHACALESDLDGFPDGDQTRVGEKGLSMSGGQKQRIALARAVYARSDVVILDDILSAVDSNTAAHIVENCLNGHLLGGRTVILVTHFVRMCARRISACELIVTMDEGEIDSQGPPQRDLAPNGSSSMLRTSSSHSSFRSHRGKEKPEEESTEYPADRQHDDSEGGADISFAVYKRYFYSMGDWKFWSTYAIINIVAHVFMIGQGWWVSQWVNAGDRDSRPGFYFGIYTGIQLTSSVSLTAMYLTLIAGAIKASRTIHAQLSSAIFGAPFRFFDVTPYGAILNRFSKDCEILDTEQVENLQPVGDYLPQVLLVAITISVILPVFLLPAAIIAAVFTFIGRLYIRNALAARKQVAEARSPLFSTLSDTSGGVVTIRAFKRTSHFSSTYIKQTDRYNRMQLYENGLDRWLEERSDAVGALVSFIVGLLAVRGGLSSGTTGFLVSTGLEFTNRVLYVVRAINKNELSLNSVQRILAYSDIEQESPSSDKGEPPASWPSGEIDFEDYSARYAEDGSDVLHGISLSIKAGEKIGIVGPSGCGKSSLSLALLRFIVPSGGQIRIDGRPLDDVNLDALRSRVTLVPQDPVLFSGTLRSNLDPNDEYDDGELWAAIQRSGFAREGKSGSSGGNGGAHGLSLDTVVHSGGANFSQGQRQLLSLARAIVRRSRILILDESTASLDNESDATMQQVIREEFDGCTLVTIAHRLETVIDFERIMCLEAGRVVEFDSPRRLLEAKGQFYALCKAAGNLEELEKRARQAPGSEGSSSRVNGQVASQSSSKKKKEKSDQGSSSGN